MNDNEKLFAALQEFDELEQQYVSEYEQKNDEWWNGLTEDEREDAFYAVCKRMFEARVKDNRSYRGTLYDKFGFGPHMYRAGMECGFFALHNMLHEALEYEAMKSVTRVEVIEENENVYAKQLADSQHVHYNVIHEDKTLKILIDGYSWMVDL